MLDYRRSGARVRVTITGANGCDGTVAFVADEEPGAITEMIRATLED